MASRSSEATADNSNTSARRSSNSDEIAVNLPECSSCSTSQCEAFASDGFIILPNVLDSATVASLNERLEYVLRGTYDRGEKPDKTPKLIKLEMATQYDNNATVQEKDEKKEDEQEHCDKCKGNRRNRGNRPGGNIGPLGFTGSRQNAKVLQIINVHKSDKLFRQLVTNANLGRTVAKLAGWKHGARLAQDQIWAKPPGSPPLTYHRDSPYFMFDPPDVVTVWIALDTMAVELGPLIYVKASHKWGDGRVGSAGTFFQRDGGIGLLKSAAEREGITDFQAEVEFVSTAGLEAGGISIHDGRTWHGSGGNRSDCSPRRGLGLHFVPAQVKFTAEAAKSKLWRQYCGVRRRTCSEDGEDEQNNNDSTTKEEGTHFSNDTSMELPEEDFPIVWRP